MKKFFSYLSVAIISSCAAQPVPAQQGTPAGTIPLPTHYLAVVSLASAAVPPKLISPHFSSQECESTRKKVIQENDIPKEVEVVCLKVVKGIEV